MGRRYTIVANTGSIPLPGALKDRAPLRQTQHSVPANLAVTGVSPMSSRQISYGAGL